MQQYSADELQHMLAAGVPYATVEKLGRIHFNYHPNHHQTCFCPVCCGAADGYLADPCECGKCQT